MGAHSRTKRETVVPARTSSSGGTATLATVTDIDGVPLEEFDEILISIIPSQNLVGTAPTLNLYFQQAVVPDPDPTNSAHWDDYAKANQFTDAVTAHQVLQLAVKPHGQVSAGATTAVRHDRGTDQPGFTPGNAWQNHWGDQLRIREVVGGTVTQVMIYDIHFIGLRRTGRRGE